ncbi:hypothetical protein LEP1GSC021_1897 [Leptospira noguchii str. 1993005606]|uniref:Uncharacterized protein n=2 Tax=Leptospira noguchii TaxID=28182 RepID=M6YUU3_9LEPT|nr:hypothetical protein LEP1GSC041_1624 [Leptospira noguchii str. 2006001870]EMN00813.1 hypothetical protein LEP1GSC035_0575 [Leptospira noguchii str. 2007001578]EMO90158.1 hypothetical protein LEP1GSC024_4149 [Leptospira noguchii str. 2001034031]EPE86419.1 hypothetical protein LEP1GSC021_1897 [Leptospira noguchii str. 1993005606]
MNKNEWYHILTGHFGYPQPEKNFEYLNQTYIPDIGCPTCKIGKIQNAFETNQKQNTVNLLV